MSGESPAVTAARIDAERARGRLIDTAHELQERLSPATLASSAWSGAKAKGADLADDAVEAVKRRPGVASGVVAAIALFLAREPLIDLAGKLGDQIADKVKTKRKPRKNRASKTTETTA
ncbi:MAG: DUF3618 domain-containing protein [Sphingomicrobium sp.]